MATTYGLLQAKSNVWFIMFILPANSIDATQEDGSLGRLINHSRKANVEVKIVVHDERPHLCMFAATNIKEGQELLYDYGERSTAIIKDFTWLKQ